MPPVTDKREKGEKVGSRSCPGALEDPLPTTKLPSTPTQQHGRRSLRDWSRTAGDSDAEPTGAAGPGTAGEEASAAGEPGDETDEIIIITIIILIRRGGKTKTGQ